MTETGTVDPQVTDSVTQANVTTLGNTSAYALAQSNLALSQSQGVLLANMVSAQQKQSIASSAATTKGIHQLFHGGSQKNKSTPDMSVRSVESNSFRSEPSPQVNSEQEEKSQSDNSLFGKLGEPFTGPLAVY